MKRLHRTDLFCWSRFDEERDLDFHSYAWIRDGGNIVFDPLPLSPHDAEHLHRLGGAQWVVVTNSDHIRDALEVRNLFGARLAGPRGEQAGFPVRCDRWLEDGEELAPGLVTFALEGSKTPGELAFLLEETTLICGDLLRCHEGGKLCLLPQQKLGDPVAARQSLRRFLDFPALEAVLVGDGWPVFRDGARWLREALT